MTLSPWPAGEFSTHRSTRVERIGHGSAVFAVFQVFQVFRPCESTTYAGTPFFLPVFQVFQEHRENP
jgi:hypothetical protein